MIESSAIKQISLSLARAPRKACFRHRASRSPAPLRCYELNGTYVLHALCASRIERALASRDQDCKLNTTSDECWAGWKGEETRGKSRQHRGRLREAQVNTTAAGPLTCAAQTSAARHREPSQLPFYFFFMQKLRLIAFKRDFQCIQAEGGNG